MRAGVIGGALFGAAALTKWTALPFGGLMGAALLGTAWGRREGRRERVLSVVVAGGITAVVAGAYLAVLLLTDKETSIRMTLQTADLDARTQAVEWFSGERLRFYPMWVMRSILSPALLAPVLGFLGVWMVRARAVGWPLLVGTVASHHLWLLARIPPTDERFALTAVPALLVGAAIGFAQVPGTVRRVAGGLVFVVAVGVGWDFHFGAPGPLRPNGTEWGLDDPRTLGLNSATFTAGGWARGDVEGVDCTGYLEQVFDAVIACDPEGFAFDASRPHVLAWGYWWNHRLALHRVLRGGGEGMPRLVSVGDERGDGQPRLELILGARPAEGEPIPPEGIAVTLEGIVDAAGCGEVHGAALWRPVELPSCL